MPREIETVEDPAEPQATAVAEPVDEATRTASLERWYEEVTSRGRTLRIADAELEEAKGVVKEKNARREAAVTQLQRAIDEKPGGLLWDHANPAEAEEWRNVDLATLSLPTAILTKLAKAEITTLGKLTEWTAKRPLRDIDGIGEVAAETIEDTLAEFWRKRKVDVGAPAEEGAG